MCVCVLLGARGKEKKMRFEMWHDLRTCLGVQLLFTDVYKKPFADVSPQIVTQAKLSSAG